MAAEHIQFVARELLSRADFLIPQWLPDGKRVGIEWVARNSTRQDAHLGSFKVNLSTGVWCDFATGDKGTDLVSVFAYLNHLSQGEAAKRLAEAHGLNDKPYTARSGAEGRAMWKPITPISANAPPPPQAHFKHGKPSRTWTYRDEQGATLCHVLRFDLPEAKQILPLTYCRNDEGKTAWRWHGLPKPRPLYNLNKLTASPQATVIICEGEKAADACSELFPEYVTTTTLNGAQSPHKTDFAPLAGRTVWLWPDTDEPGRKYAEAVAELVGKAGAREVKLLRVPGDHLPGWDAADALAEGWQASKGFELLDVHVEQVKESDQETIARLAKLSTEEYESRRKDEAKALNWRVSILDKAVEKVTVKAPRVQDEHHPPEFRAVFEVVSPRLSESERAPGFEPKRTSASNRIFSAPGSSAGHSCSPRSLGNQSQGRDTLCGG